MYNEMGLPFVSMCPRFLTRQPPNCRISGENATNARYPEKCVSEVFLHAFFGKCTRSRVPLSLYAYTCVFACVLYRCFGSLSAQAKTDIIILFRRSAFTYILRKVYTFPCTLVFVCVHTCLCLYALQVFRIVSGTSQNCNLCQCFSVDFKRQRIGSAAGAKSAGCSEKCMLGLLNEDPELRSVEPKTRRV